MKRALSLILTLLMVLSLFAGLNISTHAKTIPSDTTGDPEACFRIDRRAKIDKGSGLALTGAHVDLAPTGHYDIAVGKKVITSDNYTDVYGDGRVKYDPTTKVLTLNNPDPRKLERAYGDSYGMIHINASGVTVRGTYHMDRAYSEAGIKSDNSVTLDGSFTFYGNETGAHANEDIVVTGGSITAFGSKQGAMAGNLIVNGGVFKAVATGTGDDADGILVEKLYANRGLSRIEAQGAGSSFTGDEIIFDKTRITSDDSFFSPSARTIMRGDLKGVAKSFVIEPFSGSYYDVWVGSRQVDSENYTDIFGDGKASYDPATKTLTLADPTLVGGHTKNYNLSCFRIYATDDLTVKGSYHMTEDELLLIPGAGADGADYMLYGGVYSGKNLTLDGSFTFAGNKFSIYAEEDLTVQSGSLTALGSTNLGVRGYDVSINNDVVRFEAKCSGYPIYAENHIDIGDQLEFVTPVNGMVAQSQSQGYQYIVDTDTTSAARHVVLENHGPVTSYNVFLGAKQVTSRNMSDILNDGGSAKYEPSTGTLTLNNPTINGSLSNGGNTYKIFSADDITVKGAYAMPSDDVSIGIYSGKNLTLDGDFTFRGTSFAVYALEGGVTLKSGNITAVSGGDVGILSYGGDFTVESGVTKADVTAGLAAVFGKEIALGADIAITTPSRPALASDPDLGLKGVYDQDVGAYATHVVIEYRESVTNYGVYVGATQITSRNKDDILGDGGRAKYDPDTKTLTLDNPTIGDVYTNGSYSMKLYSPDDLTVKGRYNMLTADSSFGVYSGKSLTFDGNFTFKGSEYAAYALDAVTIASGSFTAESSGHIGVMAYRGAFTVADGVVGVELTGAYVALYANSIVNNSSDITVITPENWSYKTDSSFGLVGVFDNTANDYASYVVIGQEQVEPPTDEPTQPPTDPPTQPPTDPPTNPPTQPSTADPETVYELWVGSTQVTEKNKNDILNDGGKAKFDPSTNTLTLNNPTIEGGHNLWTSSGYAKISSFISLIIKGSYHMTSSDTKLGVGVKRWNTLTFDGDFTLFGSETPVYCDGSVVIESGTVDITATTSNRYGINCGGSLIIHEGLTKLHVVGSDSTCGAIRSAYEPELCDSAIITTPKNGVIKRVTGGYCIADSSDNAANEVVIEKDVPLDLDGEGTAGSPYLIKSTEDWNTLAEFVANGNNTSGKYFKMTNDIAVSTAVGSGGKHFSGTFDGDGHTLTLDNMSSSPFAIEGATIRNLKVDGSVSGGRHVSALIGGISGTADNLIENCHVAATITTSDTYCGGFVGHGGSSAKTVISDCVFSGTLNGSIAGTFWGWSDNGSTPVLVNCLDLSDSAQPIGRGNPSASVTNCYYTKADKETGGNRPWSNQGKLAYTVTGDDISLKDTPGVTYDGAIYAAEGERISLTVPNANELYNSSAGILGRNESILTLLVPAENVTVEKPTDAEQISGYSDAVGSGGNNNEGAENFVDGDTSTKWCYSSPKYPITITFRSNDEVIPLGYILTTANDTQNNPGRNPVSWRLEGSPDGSTWTTLSETIENYTFGAFNFEPYTFPINNHDLTSFTYYRFTVSATQGGGTFQLSEFCLISAPKDYPVWVGATQVTIKNKDDILNDGGRAKFDPKTGTLTLDEPNITDGYQKSPLFPTKDTIYSLVPLTVKGSYHMKSALNETGLETGNHQPLTIDGDFTFLGSNIGVFTNGDLTIASGRLIAIGRSIYGLGCDRVMTVNSGVGYLEAQGGVYSLWAVHGFNYDDSLKMTTPENGIYNYHLYESDGTTPAKKAVFVGQLCGDVDGDGQVTIFDASLIQRYLASMDPDPFLSEHADVDGDGQVTIFDASAIQRWLAGLGDYDQIGKPIAP